MSTAEQNYLQARKEARAPTESKDQPGNAEAVDVLEDSAPIEDVENTEVITDVENTAEIEESEAQTIETQDKETGLLYYDIDDEEVSSDQIKEWKNNGLMQADYTRKTQAHAEDVKAFDVDKQAFTVKQSKLSSQLATLEAMIGEDTLTDEAIAELREYEPEEYIKHIEKQSKRKELLKEAKVSVTPQSNVNAQEEQTKLINANPQWIKDGNATKAYQDDMTALSNYYTENGFTQDMINEVNTNALFAQTAIDAARFKATNIKKAVVEKRVRKAPVSTRPRAQATNAMTDKMKDLKSKAQSGDAKAFAQLRRLQREQK